MRPLALLVGLLYLALNALPVGAAAPEATTIVTTIVFPSSPSDPPPSGTFTATGPICPAGTFVDEFIAGGGSPRFGTYALVVRKHLTCDDGSGTFTIQFHPQGNPGNLLTFDESGPWSMFGRGTGAYTTLTGHGEFGVVYHQTEPVTGTETFVGFLQRK
jgi:hypothetical protein